MTRLWLLLVTATLLVATPCFNGFAQDMEDPIDELVEEQEYEHEDELLSILNTSEEYGSLTTLLELLQESGLYEELKGDGPFTLLAPDDSAFAQLQPQQLEKLMSDREYMKTVLSRHIVKGHRVEFGDEPQTLTIKCLNGDVITAEVTDESVRVEQAWVIDEQIECSNGIIHVIDAVLLPPKGPQKG